MQRLMICLPNLRENALRHLEACFQPLTATHEPIANVIDDNVQVYVLSHILDNFQGVAEIVLDRLPMNVWTQIWFFKRTLSLTGLIVL